jgi:colanic acid biosynthesis glycosyl transferase WcaI
MVITRATTPKSILVHAINFAPELIGCGKYTSELVQYLAHRGHLVEVVTAPPHYPGWTVGHSYNAFAYTCETFGSVKIKRCPIIVKKNGGGLWRLLAPLSFAAAAAPVIVWRILSSRPDVFLCVEPTLFAAPIGASIAKLIGIRCVLHVQDLEVDAAFDVGYVKGSAVRKIAMTFERLVLKRFDRVITISNRMRKRLVSKRVDPARITVIRNWIDTSTIRPMPSSAPNSFRKELGFTDSEFIVLYAGHIGVKQALDVLLAAARDLKDREDIQFVIAGDGPIKVKLKEDSADLPNVSFLPLQPLTRLNELLALADLHVLPQHKAAADLVLPSKLGGMLASGRPIVVTTDPGTELHDILEGVALVTPAGDYRALSLAISQAKDANLTQMVERGLHLAESLEASSLLPEFEGELFGPRE